MHSSISNSEFTREIPQLPWRGLLAAVVTLTVVAAGAWEFYARSHGYQPTLNDTPDLWAQNRETVKPDSIVLSGTSRMLFDMDLDELEQGLGQRPVQLAIVGSCPFPILADLANDESFHGTLLLDVIPASFLAPGGPLIESSERALRRRKTWNHAQRWSHQLGMLLEERIAFLKQDDLTLEQLLKKLPIPDRQNAQIGPLLPPYFSTIDRDRRMRMAAEAAIVGSPLQQRVSSGWYPLFTLPPPPAHVAIDQFVAMMNGAIEARFKDTARHVARIRARGGKVVFLRFPVDPRLSVYEERIAPLAPTWARLVSESAVPAVNFADHPELATFQCPELSHLSAPDSVEYTRRLLPHLKTALTSISPAVALAPPTPPPASVGAER